MADEKKRIADSVPHIPLDEIETTRGTAVPTQEEIETLFRVLNEHPTYGGALGDDYRVRTYTERNPFNKPGTLYGYQGYLKKSGVPVVGVGIGDAHAKRGYKTRDAAEWAKTVHHEYGHARDYQINPKSRGGHRASWRKAVNQTLPPRGTAAHKGPDRFEWVADDGDVHYEGDGHDHSAHEIPVLYENNGSQGVPVFTGETLSQAGDALRDFGAGAVEGVVNAPGAIWDVVRGPKSAPIPRLDLGRSESGQQRTEHYGAPDIGTLGEIATVAAPAVPLAGALGRAGKAVPKPLSQSDEWTRINDEIAAPFRGTDFTISAGIGKAEKGQKNWNKLNKKRNVILNNPAFFGEEATRLAARSDFDEKAFQALNNSHAGDALNFADDTGKIDIDLIRTAAADKDHPLYYRARDLELDSLYSPEVQKVLSDGDVNHFFPRADLPLDDAEQAQKFVEGVRNPGKVVVEHNEVPGRVIREVPYA